MHPSCSKCPATRFAMHLGCLQAHGKQEQKCPDGISSAHCVPGTMSDMPDRAGTGAEAQPSNNVAIQASPPSCRNNSQSSTSSLLQKRGMLLQLQNWGPVGLQNHQKESWHFQLPPGEKDTSLPKGCLLASTSEKHAERGHHGSW